MLIIAKTRGRHIERRQPQPREAVCSELQGSSSCCSCMQVLAKCCSRWYSYMIQSSPGVSTHDLDSKPSPGSPSRSARTRARANPPCLQWRRKCRRKSSTCVASPQVVSKNGAARSCVAPVAHASGLARCGVKTWRHLLTWRQGAGGVAIVARCGVKTWRHLLTCLQGAGGVAGTVPRQWPHLASQDVASERRVRRHRPTWHRWTLRQYVASGGPGLPARVFKMCLRSSGDMCVPTGDPPECWIRSRVLCPVAELGRNDESRHEAFHCHAAIEFVVLSTVFVRLLLRTWPACQHASSSNSEMRTQPVKVEHGSRQTRRRFERFIV